jgi:hypothetical protein
VFVDVLTPELRAQMTPEEWKIWKRINARPAKALAAYPDLERQDFDEKTTRVCAYDRQSNGSSPDDRALR